MALAQRLLIKPLMANHAHGLWGYSGKTEAGRELTIQSAGIGGPSAATVLFELAGFGAERVIALGACKPLDSGLGDDVVIATGARPQPDPNSTQTARSIAADPVLTAALAAACPGARSLTVASLYTYAAGDALPDRNDGEVLDLATAAVFGAGQKLGLAVACALVVAANGSDDEAAEKLVELGVRAATAFAV